MSETTPSIVFTYNKDTKAIEAHPITRMDSCLFAFFYYNGEEVAFDTKDAVVCTLYREFKPSVNTVLVSFDKKALLYIKDSDIAFQSNLLSNIMGEIRKFNP